MFNPYGSFLWQCRSDKSFDFLSNSLFIQLRCLNTKDKRKKKDVLRYTGYSPFLILIFLRSHMVNVRTPLLMFDIHMNTMIVCDASILLIVLMISYSQIWSYVEHEKQKQNQRQCKMLLTLRIGYIHTRWQELKNKLG